MNRLTLTLSAPLLACWVSLAAAEIRVVDEQLQLGSGFAFEGLPAPATNDAGTGAVWTLVDGRPDRNGAALSALHDGRVPANDDEPRANFFFQAGSAGGRIQADLGKVAAIGRIGTYSRHASDRAPQVYTVLGSEDGDRWIEIASVDTRKKDAGPGGRHGVSISGDRAGLGNFRYLRFDIRPTEDRDPFGLTFFSEIDIVTADDPELEFVPAGKPPKVLRFQTGGGDYKFQLDATEAPELLDWSEKELAPVVREWYPKLVGLLESDGYEAPAAVAFQYRNDMPAGIPAAASGSSVSLNAPWFKEQLEGEAKGCVVHELVHVVQNYWRARLVNRNARPTPGWITEGIADYIRWFLYEPETRGAALPPNYLTNAKYDASYRVTANFIDWVARNHDEKIASELNTAARNGEYDDTLWKKFTGKSVSELAESWRAQK